MQEKQQTWHPMPPVGWLAYCRFVRETLPVLVEEQKWVEEQKRKDGHAAAN